MSGGEEIFFIAKQSGAGATDRARVLSECP